MKISKLGTTSFGTISGFFVRKAPFFFALAGLLIGGGYYFLSTSRQVEVAVGPTSEAVAEASEVSDSTSDQPTTSETVSLSSGASPSDVIEAKKRELVREAVLNAGISAVYGQEDGSVYIAPTLTKLLSYTCDADTWAIYDMDMTADGTNFLDSCNGHHAVRSGSWTDVPTGQVGRAALNAAGGKAKTIDRPFLNGTLNGGVTIDVWVKNLSSTGQHYVLGTGAESPGSCGPGGQSVSILAGYPSNGNIGIAAAGIAGFCTTPAAVLNDGNWHHLAFAWSGSIGLGEAKLYIDGAVATICNPTANFIYPTNGSANCGYAHLGSTVFNNSSAGASMDQFRLSTTRRSDAWVAQQYAFVMGGAPTVTGVSSDTANGTYKIGQLIPIKVTFTEAVNVTGSPQLTLETGTTDRVAAFDASSSGTDTLVFNYTVQAGDLSSDLDYISSGALSLNGGTIKNGDDVDAELTLPAPGAAGSLGGNKALVIDGVLPTVSGVTASTGNGSYNAGDVINVQVNFTENVIVTGTPQLTLETGDTDRVVNYTSGSNSSTLVFSYTVQAGDTSADLDYVGTDSLALNGGTIRDAATNDATLTLAAPGAANSLGANKAIVIDTTAPTVTEVIPVVDPTEDTTPNFTFNSTEAGSITYGGDCSSGTTSATAGDNTITFNTLSEGLHSNCTMRVTDAAGNQSELLELSAFTVNTGPNTCPTSGTDVTINAPCQLNASTSYTYSGTLTINAALSILSHLPDYGQVVINADNITVTSNGSITATGTGYANGGGPGGGAGVNQGGSYGGYGGNNSSAPYGSVTAPTDVGSGGFNTGGARAGGSIKLNAPSGTITLNGPVTANGRGGLSFGCSGQGSSGGSVWIVAGTLAGSSNVQANGSSGWTCGGGTVRGGSGGRVSVTYGAGTPSITFSAKGGTGSAPPGGPGTIYVHGPSSTNGTLIVDNGTNSGAYNPTTLPADATFDDIQLGGGSAFNIQNGRNITLANGGDISSVGNGPSMTVSVGGMLTLGGSHVVDDVDLTNGGTIAGSTPSLTFNSSTFHQGGTVTTLAGLTLNAGSTFNSLTDQTNSVSTFVANSGATLTHGTNADSETASLNIHAVNFTLNSGASVNLNGKGYSSGNGVGAGGAGTTGTGGAGGAGHGGNGGNGTGGAGGTAHDSATLPALLGSGGGTFNGSNGGAGGGKLHLTVDADAVINGSITANGANSTLSGAGGGAGGSIYLQIGGEWSGNGSLTALGGSVNNAIAGCGAGGIVAANYASKTFSGSIGIAGGSGTCSSSGESGLSTDGEDDPNPAPVVVSISPNGKAVGDGTFTITVNGTGFVNGSVVSIDSTDLMTTYVSSSQLTASVSSTYLTTAGTRSITVTNAAPGGGTSNAVTLTVSNPAPTLSGINPTNKNRNDSAFALTVNGTGFNTQTVVKIDGANRTTTYVSPTQVTAAIVGGDLTSAGNKSITVFNPTPGGGTSTAALLTVSNAAPTTSSITPDTKDAGDGAFTLTVNGSNFYPDSVVRFNGSSRPTTYVNANQLTASISAADISGVANYAITVFNGAPGGGVSNAQTLTVEGGVVVTVNPVSPFNYERFDVSVNVPSLPAGLDEIRVYLDGTDPSNLLKTCAFSGSPTNGSCDVNVRALARGVHTIHAVAVGSDDSDNVGEKSFTVQAATTNNRIKLSRIQVSQLAEVELSYTLDGSTEEPLVVTFPDGFQILGPFTNLPECASNANFGEHTLLVDVSGCSGTLTFSGAIVVNPPDAGSYIIRWTDDEGEGTVIIVEADGITVTAAVDPYITFDVGAQDSGDACDGTFVGSDDTVSLGVLNSGTVTTSDAAGVQHICTRLWTNATNGAVVTVQSLNGALTSASVPSDAIPSASGTVTTGTAQYGVCFGSDAGDSGTDVTIPVGADPTAAAPFNGTCTPTDHEVGELNGTTQTLWTLDNPSQNAFAKIYVKAAVSGTSPAHTDYSDILTFVATGTF